MKPEWTATERCDCEHCGVLPPYTPTYWDGNTDWCEACAKANGYPEPTEDDRESFWKAKVAHHTRALQELNSQNSFANQPAVWVARGILPS